METRQIITPTAPPPAALPTHGGQIDANRFIVATPHFDAKFRLVAASASYAGLKFDIAVPTSLAERVVYADIAAEDGNADVGSAEGTVNFYLGGQRVLVLPFDFMPAATAGGKSVGFHVTSGGITNAAQNTLGLDVGTAARLIVPGWALRINCSKIEIELTRGTAGLANCYVVLGCLSQGREEA